MEIDVQQLKYHVELLSGDPNAPWSFQLFHDADSSRIDLATNVHGTVDDLLPFFKSRQAEGCGIYPAVHKMDGKGRKKENIVEFQRVFIDWDGQPEPKWHVTPHWKATRSPLNGHAYYNVKGIVSIEQNEYWQRRAALSLGTDEKVTDSARVSRGAGTWHLKDCNNPTMYKIRDDYTQLVGKDHVYTITELEKAFPLTEEQDKQLHDFLLQREGKKSGDGLTDKPNEIIRVTNYLKNTAPIGVENSNGSWNVYRAACVGLDHGIVMNTMKDLMWEHFNPRCEPPWSDYQRHQFDNYIENAYLRYAKSNAGCMTAVGAFTSKEAPEVPEPIGGWQANNEMFVVKEKTEEEIVEIKENKTNKANNRVNRKQGTLNETLLTDKCSDYEYALALDGILFNGEEAYRFEKDIFVFNGKYWETIDTDVLRNKIQRVFARLKLNNSKVKSVLEAFCDVITIPFLKEGAFLSDNSGNDGNWVCFKNGIFNIITGERKDHTHDFFTLSMCDYDFLPENTEAPVWTKTITDIYQGCSETVLALEEWFGYVMSNNNQFHNFAFKTGLPRSGKGTTDYVMELLVGSENISAPSLSKIIDDPIIAMVTRKKLLLCTEANSVSVHRRDPVVNQVKLMSAFDNVSFDRKFKTASTMRPSCKIMMSSNSIPEFIDSSGALAERMLAFPHHVSFAGREDRDLNKKLKAEIPAIAQRCLRAFRGVLERGRFTQSQLMIDEKEELKEDLNPLTSFFNNFCEFGDNYESDSKELHDYYIINARHNHVRNPMSFQKFCRELKSAGYITKKKNGVRVRMHIRLREDSIKTLASTANVAQFPNRKV